MLMLYISKSGSIIVGVFILPWYQELLGPEAFGVVALVFSLQAFLIMLDLGTSTIVGRDLAASGSSLLAIKTLLAAQIVLHVGYFVFLFVALVVGYIWIPTMPVQNIVACVLFFWALTVQNVGQSALLARKKYILAGAIQIIGVLSRSAITIAGLIFVSTDIDTFLVTQAATAIGQMLFTAWVCSRVLDYERVHIGFHALISYAGELVKRGRPLLVFGLAGAAVMQLDKVIVSAFASPVQLAPYYLASALCLTPISILAGPVSQYFQPSIISGIHHADIVEANRQIRLLLIAIIFAVILPSTFIWLGRDIIVSIWLDGQPNADDVAHYVSILLPGIALGAFGYIPFAVLIAYQDYKVQAQLSAAMTLVTLFGVAIFSVKGDIKAVCWIYALYHSLSTVVSWLRAHWLQRHSNHDYVSKKISLKEQSQKMESHL